MQSGAGSANGSLWDTGAGGEWEHERCRECSRKRVGRQEGAESTVESWGQDRQEMRGECVGCRNMQGEQGWCQGKGKGHALTRVCSSESPVSAAMRHSVVGSGCLFTLQKLYSRISSCSSVGVTGFSEAISSWGRAMVPGTVERGQCHCPSLQWPVGPQLLNPIPIPTSSRSLWSLATAEHNFLPKSMPDCSARAPAPQQLLPQFPHCGNCMPTAPS